MGFKARQSNRSKSSKRGNRYVVSKGLLASLVDWYRYLYTSMQADYEASARKVQALMAKYVAKEGDEQRALKALCFDWGISVNEVLDGAGDDAPRFYSAEELQKKLKSR